jgi:DNA-binding MarR family transcriptional regulator
MPSNKTSLSDHELRRASARVVATCNCFSLRRAARAVSQLYDDALRPSGLRGTQFTLLTLIAGHGVLSVNELAEASGTDRTTLTRNLALLERDDLVQIGSDAGDARVRQVSLTAAGKIRITNALPLWQRAQARLQAQVGPESLLALRTALGVVVDAAVPS